MVAIQNIIRDELNNVVNAIKDLYKIERYAADDYLSSNEKQLIENLMCTVEHAEKEKPPLLE